MNNSLIIAIAIVAAAVIVKLPGPTAPGRYQITGAGGGTAGIYRVDTVTGDAWMMAWTPLRWQPFSDNGPHLK